MFMLMVFLLRLRAGAGLACRLVLYYSLAIVPPLFVTLPSDVELLQWGTLYRLFANIGTEMTSFANSPASYRSLSSASGPKCPGSSVPESVPENGGVRRSAHDPSVSAAAPFGPQALECPKSDPRLSGTLFP